MTVSGVESGITQALAAVALLILGGAIKFAFDRWGVQLGLSREEKRAQDGKIERIDTHARDSIARVERELGSRLGGVERAVGILAERVDHLPTEDDIQRLSDGLARVDRGLGAVQSSVEGINQNVRTVLQHILAGEGK